MGTFTDNLVDIFINGTWIDRMVFQDLEPDYSPLGDFIEYIQNERLTIIEDGNQGGHSNGWPEGDTYISQKQVYLDEMEARQTIIDEESDYSIGIAAQADHENSLPNVDASYVLSRTYRTLVIKEHIAPNNNIIGVWVDDFRGNGGFEALSELFKDCDDAGIYASAHTHPYAGTNEAEYLQTLEDMGLVVGDEVADSTRYVYKAPDMSLEKQKLRSLEAIKVEHARRLAEFTGHATIEERDTWTVQLNAAKAYTSNGNASDEDFLLGLLTDAEIENGANATTMADKITQKALLTKTLIQMAGKMKRTADELINSAANVEDLNEAIAVMKTQEAATIAAFKAALTT